MKKMAVICVCFAVFLVSGCDSMFKYDIVLKNTSGGTLGVNLGSSSSFYTLGNNDSHTFTDIESGRQYVYVKDTLGNIWQADVDITSDTTYSIIWENSKITLTWFK